MLKGAALGAAGVVGVGVPLGGTLRAKAASALAPKRMPVPYRRDFVRPPVLTGRPVDLGGVRATQFEVRARAGEVEIAPGIGTTVWGYDGIVPGPTVSVRAGEPSVLRVRNRLPATHPLFGHEFRTSTHLHGSASKPQYDGYANDLTPPGFYKDYRYPNSQGARTMWYHDHAVHTTAQNVYTGLAAAYLVHDPREESLLPQGEFDVPLVLSDCILDERGQLAYDDNGHSGLWGDILLVNGVPWPVMKVKARIYRFRVLAATLGRSFRFRFSNGMPAWVVATDGGLVPTARRVTSWRHGQAERYEVLVDFRGLQGQRIELLNLSNPNNVDYDNTGRVIRFDVQPANAWPDDGSTVDAIPTVLNPDEPTMRLKESDAVQRRSFRLHRKNGGWVINDETWEEVVASSFQRVQANPALGAVELWTLENTGGGWFHPTHLHLVDFQILDRNGRPPFDHERGPKDVVYLGENEKVRVLARFGPHRGRYMIHCHNTPHEDHDMMTQFSVGYRAGDPDPDDPISADPCRLDDLPD
jgi:spore coat protein A, manganese oxidase